MLYSFQEMGQSIFSYYLSLGSDMYFILANIRKQKWQVLIPLRDHIYFHLLPCISAITMRGTFPVATISSGLILK